ncbi:hypothetical protein Nepgr_023928 [Nepenthes gracilis]|uniref:Uncharacterized protein n=1 Tax=Nepenthes gracilis TaxID=150966 RepID=A0AAD3T292_NEPGR|nr:hypothetical protein Nepgr_023928 [Nepenthes gracilis]
MLTQTSKEIKTPSATAFCLMPSVGLYISTMRPPSAVAVEKNINEPPQQRQSSVGIRSSILQQQQVLETHSIHQLIVAPISISLPRKAEVKHRADQFIGTSAGGDDKQPSEKL